MGERGGACQARHAKLLWNLLEVDASSPWFLSNFSPFLSFFLTDSSEFVFRRRAAWPPPRPAGVPLFIIPADTRHPLTSRLSARSPRISSPPKVHARHFHSNFPHWCILGDVVLTENY